MSYAERTQTSVQKSQLEILSTLNRFGIADAMFGAVGGIAVVTLGYKGRQYALRLKLPEQGERRFTHTPGRGTARSEPAAYAEWEQACRSKWRELLLLIKAKLVAVENGVADFGNEFLAYMMLPDRSTVGEWAEARIGELQSAGMLPQLALPGRNEAPNGD